jgi:DNA (cytosine-5)-methyltransferase 1
LRELALFAGAGGGILGGLLLGWRTVCAVEIDPYCRRVLLARQRDGVLSPFPIWDDVRTFDGRPWRGAVDVISGGFPCQDISSAGRGAGIDGTKSGLWREMARIIREVGPRHVLVENSPMLTSRGLGRVLGDLAEMGFHARWGVLGADDAGAPHIRKRIWIAAHADGEEQRAMPEHAEVASASAADAADADRDSLQLQPRGGDGQSRTEATLAEHDGEPQPVADAEDLGRGAGRTRRPDSGGARERELALPDVGHAGGAGCADAGGCGADAELGGRGAVDSPGWWDAEPAVGRVADGVASRVDRGRAIGNGQVPAVVRFAWETLAVTAPAGTGEAG